MTRIFPPRFHGGGHRREDAIGIAVLLAIFIAALLLAKLFAGVVIGVGQMMLG